jgi:ABC-type nitrate/sulfonate/bicarbonate transport system substrate-binding protein
VVDDRGARLAEPVEAAMAAQAFRVAVFPGAANAPLYLALERGWFAEAGLAVDVIEVPSSDEQMRLWVDGGIGAMHTSPDHLLRARWPFDPAIVRNDGFGELSVYRRPDAAPLESVEWAVDGLDSGYAFVLRALLEDMCGLPYDRQKIVAIGGTKQRFDALLANGEIGGTTLHPPFDQLAGDAGCVRLAGHLELLPDLEPQVTIVPSRSIGTAAVDAYLAGLDRAVAELLAGGEAAIAAVLRSRGLPEPAAAAGAAGLLGPGGLGVERAPTVRGLEAFADLRRRYSSGWRPPVPLAALLADRKGA